MSTTGIERLTEPVYLDASALVKLFVPEDDSDALNQALAGLTDVIVSDLALTEMASALSRRTREQRLSRADAQRLYREASKLPRGVAGGASGPCSRASQTKKSIGALHRRSHNHRLGALRPAGAHPRTRQHNSQFPEGVSITE